MVSQEELKDRLEKNNNDLDALMNELLENIETLSDNDRELYINKIEALIPELKTIGV